MHSVNKKDARLIEKNLCIVMNIRAILKEKNIHTVQDLETHKK